MIKIIVDTNVLISGLIGKGYSKLILKEILINKIFLICTSEDCIEEFERVLQYKHLEKYPQVKEEGKSLLDEIKTLGLIYTPAVKIVLLKDISDNKFLELAITAKANYLITGNHNDFVITEFHNTKIVSPKTFWELYQQNNL